jgi:hypothetical protein
MGCEVAVTDSCAHHARMLKGTPLKMICQDCGIEIPKNQLLFASDELAAREAPCVPEEPRLELPDDFAIRANQNDVTVYSKLDRTIVCSIGNESEAMACDFGLAAYRAKGKVK